MASIVIVVRVGIGVVALKVEVAPVIASVVSVLGVGSAALFVSTPTL